MAVKRPNDLDILNTGKEKAFKNKEEKSADESDTSEKGMSDPVIITVHPDTTYPNDVWEDELKNEVETIERLIPTNPKSKVKKNCIRFVCMSDTHSKVERSDFINHVPSGDVLLHTGDFTYLGSVTEFENFNDFLGQLPHRIKLVIPGNHEFNLDPREYRTNAINLRRRLSLPSEVPKSDPLEHIEHLKGVVSNARILIDSLVKFCGIGIYGVSWLPLYGVHGFGLNRGAELLSKYNLIPPGIDILMSHGPPLGFGDLTIRNKHVGCVELLNSVRKRIKPKYLVCGHIHEGYGVQTDGVITYINASSCSKTYQPCNDPIVFDYPLPLPYTREDFLTLTLESLLVTKCDIEH